MQPFQLHLTHITNPHSPLLLPKPPISRVTELLFHPLVPVHRRSGGNHTTLSPGMIIRTKRAACWPPGMKSPLCRALHGYEKAMNILQKKKKKTNIQREKKLNNLMQEIAWLKNQTQWKAGLNLL